MVGHVLLEYSGDVRILLQEGAQFVGFKPDQMHLFGDLDGCGRGFTRQIGYLSDGHARTGRGDGLVVHNHICGSARHKAEMIDRLTFPRQHGAGACIQPHAAVQQSAGPVFRQPARHMREEQAFLAGKPRRDAQDIHAGNADDGDGDPGDLDDRRRQVEILHQACKHTGCRDQADSGINISLATDEARLQGGIIGDVERHSNDADDI